MSTQAFQSGCLFSGILLGGGSLLAADASPAPIHELAGSSVASLFRVLAAFALVLAVFGAVIWALKNWQRLVLHKGLSPKLQVLEAKSLGHRHALYVVGYEDQRLLLAASPTGVTLLSHLPPGAVQEQTEPETALTSTWAAMFDLISKRQRS